MDLFENGGGDHLLAHCQGCRFGRLEMVHPCQCLEHWLSREGVNMHVVDFDSAGGRVQAGSLAGATGLIHHELF